MKCLTYFFFTLYTTDKPCMAFKPTHSLQSSVELDKPSLLVSHSSPLSPSRDRSIGCAETSVRGGACSDCTLALFGKVVCSAVVETFLIYKILLFGVELNRSTSPIKQILQLAMIVSVIFGSSYFGQIIDIGMSAATRQVMSPNEIPGDADWYLNLRKPNWNPPGWLFPIMWLIVSKPTQLAAVWKLMTSNGQKNKLEFPFFVYCVHLSLGDAWNKVFFEFQCIGRGVVVIFAFWSILLYSAYLFYNVDPSAGILVLPTCLWVAVAAALNLSIYILNKQGYSSC